MPADADLVHRKKNERVLVIIKSENSRKRVLIYELIDGIRVREVIEGAIRGVVRNSDPIIALALCEETVT